MNREIKFRALKDDISNCNWFYGQLVYDAIGQPRITAVDKSGEGLTFHTCLKGTESQYTGLKDKNGKEIYEGDIIRKEIGVGYESKFYPSFPLGTQSKYFPLIVEWDNENACWKRLELHNDINFITEIEVIGNIYENPELL